MTEVDRTFRLRDGSRVRVRPVVATDANELQRAFALLSDLSRYQRFMTGTPRLTDRVAHFFSDVDHRNHEALVALEPGSSAVVGVARFIRNTEKPTEADLAITISDGWQGRGLGSTLLRLLCERAREEDVRRFTLDMLADNTAMIGLLRSVDGVSHQSDGPVTSGHINVSVDS